MPNPDRRWRAPLIVGAVLVVAVVAMVQPTAPRLSRNLVNAGDPALYIWTLSWVVHAAFHHPAHLLDGPIYFPHHLTIAYSDTLIPLAPIYGVLHWATRSWEWALNLLTMLLILGNTVATYLLAHRLLRRRDAAVIAAFGFGFSGYVLAHIGHLNLLTLGFLPLNFLVLFRLLERPRVRAGVLLGVLSALLFMCSAYYAVIWAVSAATAIAVHLVAIRLRPTRQLLGALAALAGSAFVVVAPVAQAYITLQRNPAFRRGPQPFNGLKPVDLFTPTWRSHLYRHLLSGDTRNVEHHFFPGFLIMGLAALGLLAWMFTRRGDAKERIREIDLLMAAGVVAFVLALGDSVRGHTAPLRYLRHVPGVDGIREPARFALVPILAGVVLAGLGFARLTAGLLRRPAVIAVTVVTAGAVLAELAGAYSGVPFDDGPATLAAYRAMARKPAGAVLELPLADTSTIPGVIVEAPRMAYATLDWHPRWNGYTAFTPPRHVQEGAVFSTFPSTEALLLADTMKIRYVILHTGGHNGIAMFTEQQVSTILTGLPRTAATEQVGPDWIVDLHPSH